MAKLTVKDIEAQVKAAQVAREQLSKSKQESEDKAQEYRTKADAAAVAGDVETYKQYKQLADDAEAMAYVCGKQLEAEQGEAVTKEQTQEAWEGYAEQYGKRLAAKLKEFDNAKTEMLKLYAEAVELQAEACATRERLAGYAGVSFRAVDLRPVDGDYPMGYISCELNAEKDACPLQLYGVRVTDKDAVYYVANDLQKRNAGVIRDVATLNARAMDVTVQKVDKVVRLHRAV